ncbi:MFS transporter [Thalassorhabdomicrobium marinisediminis]|uniref:MFS transporter n=1 Tax=Thalassorhabdomicrobium marinisediminis TaxID=2170577 RepID=A0A2T7FTE4_9RHOB|nr:MFS transporter [Thalassorhabdomicrobium marinisediminis]PVA05435.1 MFS transporter [Thalassorhabdomicrobium marinisediminis]
MAQTLRDTLASVRSLLGGTAAFVAGNSLLGVVLPLRMEAADYPVALIGVIMSAYYLGLALGGFRSKLVILRIGHIRAFSVFAAITAATCLAYDTFFGPAAWVILRVINGFCIAGMTTTVESWLNERSSNKTRGRVLGAYMLAFYLAMALGQTLVNLAPVGDGDLLDLSAVLIGLSLVPIAMTGLGKPDLRDIRVLGVRQIFAASKIGVVGAGVAGVLIGSFYGLAIVFARQIGLSVSEAALFMSVVVLGGLVFQVPIGMLADRFDRRIVMASILLTVGASWGLLSISIAHGVPLTVLMGMALVFGGAISSVYPLCVAQTFDRLDRKFYVAASGRLLMVYSIGATIGPLLTSALLAAFGPSAFFIFESVIAVGYALFVLSNLRKAQQLPEPEREKFVPLPDSSPAALVLDPRTEPETSDPT